MGRVSRVKRKREPRQGHPIKIEYLINGSSLSQTVAGNGEVCGRGDQVSTTTVHTEGFTGESETPQKREGQMYESGYRWWSWLKPKPTYFDTVTSLVEQTTDLECKLKEDEDACHERLKEIEAARRELKVRVFRG